jgi:hypothetical protein
LQELQEFRSCRSYRIKARGDKENLFSQNAARQRNPIGWSIDSNPATPLNTARSQKIRVLGTIPILF